MPSREVIHSTQSDFAYLPKVSWGTQSQFGQHPQLSLGTSQSDFGYHPQLTLGQLRITNYEAKDKVNVAALAPLAGRVTDFSSARKT